MLCKYGWSWILTAAFRAEPLRSCQQIVSKHTSVPKAVSYAAKRDTKDTKAPDNYGSRSFQRVKSFEIYNSVDKAQFEFRFNLYDGWIEQWNDSHRIRPTISSGTILSRSAVPFAKKKIRLFPWKKQLLVRAGDSKELRL